MKKILLILTLSGIFLCSCNEEFIDPTRPSESNVYSNRDGLIGVSNGLQAKWSLGGLSPAYAIIIANGCATNELTFSGGAGNNNELALEAGGTNVLNINTVVNNLWSQILVVRSESQKVIDKINIITVPVEKASILAHASIFKAMSLGTLAQFFEQVPIVVQQNAPFSSRTDVLNEAINTLLATLPSINNATGFSGLASSIKYKDTVYALLARYYNMIGDDANALLYANLVNLNTKSTYLYDAVSENPVFRAGFFQTPAVGSRPRNRNFGLPTILIPNPLDGRINFYFTPSASPINYGSLFDSAIKLIPVYLPGEMTLIKAECYARTSQLLLATNQLNLILQKTVASDAFGIGANLPAYSGSNTQSDLLLEIYKNRCIELHMSGLKFEDVKRFSRPIPTFPIVIGTAFEYNRNYFPYPQSERFNNTNTPQDPAF